jgi:hypothetical protein
MLAIFSTKTTNKQQTIKVKLMSDGWEILTLRLVFLNVPSAGALG